MVSMLNMRGMKEVMNNIIPLHATPLYYLHDADYRCDDDEWDSLNKVVYEKSHDNYLSKSQYVLSDYGLHNLMRLCKYHLDIYTRDILKIDQTFRITNSWLSKKTPGQSHHIHNHPNSIFSGVFYINVKDSEIFFENTPPILKDYKFDYTYSEWNLLNSPRWSVEVTTGSMVIFPSHLNHGVEVNESDETRIVLGFNSFVTGKLNNYGYCTDLTL